MTPCCVLLFWSVIVEERIYCQTPTPGKKGTSILLWKYKSVRAAIRKALGRSRTGVPFSDLPELVDAALPASEKMRLGSLLWYVTTVKLHLETIGEIERVPGASPQRLRIRRAAG